MFTPYDWQEGIGNRAQYIESRLAQGAPVLAKSLAEGILLFTYRRQAQKIYEVYDQIVFSAVGQQSDIEALRSSALEFASREAYNRSDEDVNVQRVVTALSAPLKKAFSDFSSSPIIARSIFAEVGPTPEDDLYFVLDYDGDYALSRHQAVAAGTLESGTSLEADVKAVPDGSIEETVEALKAIWLKAMNPEGTSDAAELTAGLSPEAVLLERSDAHENRFRKILS